MNPQRFFKVENKFREYLELLNLYLGLGEGYYHIFNNFQNVGWSLNHIFAQGPYASEIDIDHWSHSLASNIINGFCCYLNEFPTPTEENHRIYHQHHYIKKMACCVLGNWKIKFSYLSGIEVDTQQKTNYDWEFFNKNISPVVHQLLQFRQVIWLRHGYEDYDYLPRYTEGEFTPNTNYPTNYKEVPTQGWWAIEIGDLPFRMNMLAWDWPLGFLPVPIYRKMLPQNKIEPCKNHFAATGHIPFKEWIFLVRDEDKQNYPRWHPLLNSKGVLSQKCMELLIDARDKIVNSLKINCSKPKILFL